MATQFGDTPGDLTGGQVGGDSTLTDFDAAGGTLFGDAGGTLSGNARGGGDQLFAFGSGLNQLFGDGFSMTDNSQGGNDRLLAGGNQAAVIYGDAAFMSGNAHGGNDEIIGFGNYDYLSGDAYSMSGSTTGGNDRVSVTASGSGSFIVGDAVQMSGNAIGGNDDLNVHNANGGTVNTLMGDAQTMTGSTRGGNDRLTVDDGGQFNALVGDAITVIGDSNGPGIVLGSDYLRGGGTLSGPPGAFLGNFLYGDGVTAGGKVVAGDDTLISAQNTRDDMWGDFGDYLSGANVARGHNIFIFDVNNGHDFIHDFVHGNDKISVQAFAPFGITQFSQLNVTSAGGDSVVHFSANNDVTVLGVSSLSSSDFLF